MDAHKEAADALKKRFQRDHKALQEGLETERQRQRKNILDRLAAKKKGLKIVGTEGGDVQTQSQELEEGAKADLEALNANFEERQADALADPQGAILLYVNRLHVHHRMLRRLHVYQWIPVYHTSHESLTRLFTFIQSF